MGQNTFASCNPHLYAVIRSSEIMVKQNSILLAAAIGVALAGHGQNTPATATPQTRSSAPAALGSGVAVPSTTQGSSRRGAPANRGATPQTGTQGGNAPGITGVPRYRAGFRGQRGVPAPVANADVAVTGRNDGSGKTQGAESATLPGMAMLRNAFGIAKGTPLQVRLLQPVDSGHAKNGDTVRGVLAAPAGSAPAGAPVELTVVAVAAAGQISSNGELSLQVISIGGQMVLSDVITAEGKEGAKLLPDDAPARGTEAIFTPDQPITLPAG